MGTNPATLYAAYLRATRHDIYHATALIPVNGPTVRQSAPSLVCFPDTAAGVNFSIAYAGDIMFVAQAADGRTI